MVHRLPATCPTVASVVAGGAKTTDAGSAAGARRPRRTKSPRRQAGGHGAARGSHIPSDQRGPLVPSPALNRSQPSVLSAARTLVPWGCRPARQTSACPETALPSAWSCSAPPPAAAAQRHRRSRLSPTRRAPPHRRPAGACDAPGAGAGHKAARLVPQRAGHAPGRLSLLVVERGRGQARRGRPHARTPATPQCGHAPPGLLCPSTDAPPPPPAGPFCATRFPRGPAPRVDRL